MATDNINPEDLPPANLSPDDFIPDSIYQYSNTDDLRNSRDAVAPTRVVDAEAFASVPVTLLYRILDHIEDLIYPLAFPIDLPYIADFVILAREDGIDNPEMIGEIVILSLFEEGILREDFGPFDQSELEFEAKKSEAEKKYLDEEFGLTPDNRVLIPLLIAVYLANGLVDYVMYAKKMERSEGQYSKEILRASQLLNDLLSVIATESIDETSNRWERDVPPGDQKILIPRAGLFACVRVMESAVRMFEAEIWKTDLFWTASFRKQASQVRDFISYSDKDKEKEKDE